MTKEMREEICDILRQIPSDIRKYIACPTLAPKYDYYIDEIYRVLRKNGVIVKDDRSLPNEIRTSEGNLCYFRELV